MGRKNKTNKVCNRCHTHLSLDSFTKDKTICDVCLKSSPKRTSSKIKSVSYFSDKEEDRFLEIWGSAGLYL